MTPESPTARSTQPLRRAVIHALAVMVVAACVACSRPQQGAPPRGPASVTVISITPRDVAVGYEFVAQTQSSRAVNIQARVSGFLDQRVYTEGSLVKQGQVLFLMDKKPFQAQLDQAKAALQQQQAAMETAAANLARTKPLVEQDALSQKDLDDAKGQYLQNAAAVEQAKQQVVQAQLNLSYCTITSPVDGISSYAQQADGTYISSSNSQLTTVSVLSPMWVNFSISENQFQSFLDDIKKGLLKPPPDRVYEVEAILVDGSVYPRKGRITFLQPEYDTKTGTFLVRASVANSEGILRPNQYVRARVSGLTRPNAILVPRRAVQQGAKGHFVWVVDKDNKAESRPVSVGQWHENDWFITEGLTAGERVVVDGGVALAPGAPVQVAQAPAGAQPEPAAGAQPKSVAAAPK